MVALFGTIFGGLGVLFSGISLLNAFNKPRTYGDFAHYLENKKFIEGGEVYKNYGEFLDFCDQILPYIQNKMKYNFLKAISYVVPSGIFMGVDFKHIPDVLDNTGIEFFDVLIFITYIGIAIVIKKNRLLGNSEERDFIKNYTFLLDEYYKDFVAPKMKKMNSIISVMYKNRLKNGE